MSDNIVIDITRLREQLANSGTASTRQIAVDFCQLFHSYPEDVTNSLFIQTVMFRHELIHGKWRWVSDKPVTGTLIV